MSAHGAASEAKRRIGEAVGSLLIGKYLLNALAERAASAAERSRFAALPARYLEDVGMTEAERAAALGYAEPIEDGWRVVASHL